MTEFDKKMRELSRNMKIPEGYSQKIDGVLQSLPEKKVSPYKKKHWLNRKKIGFAFCLICFILLVGFNSIEVNADIFESFRLTIMDIFHIGETENSVESNKMQIESKPDLMMELQETVIDSHNIYLLVKITAPASIEFSKDIAFDYIAFCNGGNYNTDNLIGGATDCYLLETMEGKPNIATYVVTLTSNMDLQEGKDVTVCLKDLEQNPFSDNSKMLVEGMWSIQFPLEMTVRDDIVIEGNADMKYPFVDTMAVLKRVELTPLGITIYSDVSDFPYEELGLSDTTIALTLKMLDGSEQMVMSHNPEDELVIDSGSIEYEKEEEKSYQIDTYSFREVLDINKVVGICIEDLYIPVDKNN